MQYYVSTHPHICAWICQSKLETLQTCPSNKNPLDKMCSNRQLLEAIVGSLCEVVIDSCEVVKGLL